MSVTTAFVVVVLMFSNMGFSHLSELKLQEFHRKYYHPSNARIWFYGDDDPSERLRILSGNK